MSKVGLKDSYNKHVIDFYENNYDLVDTPDYNKSTRLLKPKHGIYRVGNKYNRSCRFCGKSEGEVIFSDIPHALPESIGNKVLASHYECDTCNCTFGKNIENHYGNYFQMYHSIMQIHGKKGIPKFTYNIPCPLRSDECKIKCIEISYSDGKPIIKKCREVGDRYLKLNENSFDISLPIPKCNPIAVFKAIVKMAITVLPFTELPIFSDTITWLLDTEHKNIYTSNKKLLVRYEMIPGFDVTKYPHFFIFRRKNTIFNLPYMLFNLTYGCFSMLIEVPRNYDNTSANITDLPFPHIPFHTSTKGIWDMTSNTLQPKQSHNISLSFGSSTEMSI